MILFDTSVIIEILRKNNKIIEKIIELKDTPLFTTQIVVMELMYGITSNKFYLDKPDKKISRINAISDLLTRFTILDFDRKAAIKTAEILGKLKLDGNIIDFRDGMIIGIGLSNGINSFFTLNRSHFERVEEVVLI